MSTQATACLGKMVFTNVAMSSLGIVESCRVWVGKSVRHRRDTKYHSLDNGTHILQHLQRGEQVTMRVNICRLYIRPIDNMSFQ